MTARALYPYTLPATNEASGRRWILERSTLQRLLTCVGATKQFDPQDGGACSFVCAADLWFGLYLVTRKQRLTVESKSFALVAKHASDLADALLVLHKQQQSCLSQTRAATWLELPLPDVARTLRGLARAARADKKAAHSARGRGVRVDGDTKARRHMLVELWFEYRLHFGVESVDATFVEAIRLLLSRPSAHRRAIREEIRRAIEGHRQFESRLLSVFKAATRRKKEVQSNKV